MTNLTRIQELCDELVEAAGAARVDITISQLDRASFDAAPGYAIQFPWTTPTGWQFSKAVYADGSAIHYSTWQPPETPACGHQPDARDAECYACAAATGHLVPTIPAA